MATSFRKPEILEIARRDGKVTVEGLASHFDVTLQTIRRDLMELAQDGELERVHGGAVLPSGTANIGYDARRALHAEAKTAIGRACAEAIPNDCAIFLNLGTSTEAVARALMGHRGLLVVTNNMNIANILVANPAIDVVVAGGSLRRSDGGLVGSLTAQVVEQFRFDIGVIGCSALDPGGDILDYDIAEVGVSRTILRQSRRGFLVADGSKFHRSAPARIGDLAELDTFFTDVPPPAALITRLAERGTRVTVAAP